MTQKLLALVPGPAGTRLPAPLRRALAELRARVRAALDLPSRGELIEVLARIDDIDRRFEELAARRRDGARAESDAIAELGAEKDALRALRRELELQLDGGTKRKAGKGKAGKDKDGSARVGKKKKAKKGKTEINVGSPKAMKERRKRAKPKKE